MGVGLYFLRQKEDGTWEGNGHLRGWTEFGSLQDVYFARGGPPFIYFREDEYELDFDAEGPPYPAKVSKDLALTLLDWIERERPTALAVLRQLTDEELEPYTDTVKRLLEKFLEEGYAVLVSP